MTKLQQESIVAACLAAACRRVTGHVLEWAPSDVDPPDWLCTWQTKTVGVEAFELHQHYELRALFDVLHVLMYESVHAHLSDDMYHDVTISFPILFTTSYERSFIAALGAPGMSLGRIAGELPQFLTDKVPSVKELRDRGGQMIGVSDRNTRLSAF